MVNGTSAMGMCRIVVRAPESTFELTVPTDVPIADLLPTVVGYAGADLDEAGLEHGGWILQRLGGEPLDDDATTDAAGLHHGDAVYLRPRNDAVPPVHFDDLVDGVATSLRERGGSWQPALSRRLLLAGVVTLLAACLVVLALPGQRDARIACAIAVGVLLLAGAASAARAVGDGVTGTTLALGAIPFLAFAAGMLPTGTDPDLLGARVLAGGAAALGMAAIALAVVGSAGPVFLGVGLTALLTTIGGGIMVAGVPLARTAAAMSVVAILLGTVVPAIGFRLSGLRLPPLPGNTEQLQEGIDPHDAQNVMTRSAIGERYVTALNMAIAVVYTACLTGLLAQPGWPVDTLLVLLALLALLHGRSLGGIAARLAVLLPGGYGLVLFVFRLSVEHPGQRLAVVGGVLLVAAGLAITSWTIPGRRMLPHWGQAANLLHTLIAVAVLPVVLIVFRVYQILRGI